MTEDMEKLGNSLFLGNQPDAWVPYAYPSKKNLESWFTDLLLRIEQLAAYSEDMTAPHSLWISGLFNPMSFLTAIMQVTARSQQLPLDDMMLKTTVINVTNPEDIKEAAAVGAYIHGFTVQGATWELGRGDEQGNLIEMIPKELTPVLPVMQVTAIRRQDHTKAGFYECPVYSTTARGPTYVFTAWLKMESEEYDDKLWILAGVALVMQPE